MARAVAGAGRSRAAEPNWLIAAIAKHLKVVTYRVGSSESPKIPDAAIAEDLLSAPGNQGQPESERCTLSDGASGLDRSAQHRAEAGRDGEPEAGAVLGAGETRVGLPERLAQPVLVRGGDARPGIADAHHEFGFRLADGDCDLAAGSKLDRVSQEVDEDLAQLARVAADRLSRERCL